MSEQHPTTVTWKLPPAQRPALPAPLQRTNLRALAARPGRFEHHLMVVGTVGSVQIEAVTASEPLFFAHQNLSDEYVISLPTGDAMIDSFPFLTFFSDVDSGEDVGRIKHRAGEMILHPDGFLHWPGRLRPPYTPFEFAPGMRRCGVTAVVCANTRTPPDDRPLFVSPGHDKATKQYGDTEVPFVLADLAGEDSRLLGAVGDVRIELAVAPESWSPPAGGYALVLESSGEPCFDADLIHVPAGATLKGDGIARVIYIYSETTAADQPPASWSEIPAPPFAPYEDAAPGTLPVRAGELSVEEASADRVAVRIGDSDPVEIPRYWLARMCFRIALHNYGLGYLETYGGFYYADQEGYRLGLRGVGSAVFSRQELAETVERLYRAVAPEGYTERLD
jgi:hypothetical protein